MTPAERRVYDALVKIGVDGWPVTVREVQRELGYASSDSPHRLLCNLVAKGCAARSPRNERGGFRAVPMVAT